MEINFSESLWVPGSPSVDPRLRTPALKCLLFELPAISGMLICAAKGMSQLCSCLLSLIEVIQ